MSQDGRYVDEQGHVFSLSKDEAERRGMRPMRKPRVVPDAPAAAEPETKAVETPPANKAVTRSPSTKGRGR